MRHETRPVTVRTRWLMIGEGGMSSPPPSAAREMQCRGDFIFNADCIKRLTSVVAVGSDPNDASPRTCQYWRPLDPRKANIGLDANALNRNGTNQDRLVERFCQCEILFQFREASWA
jgi:hypothetical protein